LISHTINYTNTRQLLSCNTSRNGKLPNKIIIIIVIVVVVVVVVVVVKGFSKKFAPL